MIWNIPQVVKLPNKILQLPLQNFLEESVKQMMITEPELAGFTLVLERLDLTNTEIPLEELLKICFFISKINFESDEDILKTMKDNLKAQFKNFEQNLMKVNPSMPFSISEINKRYQKLNRFMHSNVNYTYYVDDIIRLSPPYQISDKKFEKKEENSIKKAENTEKIPENSQKKPFTIKYPKAKSESLKTPEYIESILDQHLSGLDYNNLLPLETHENYLELEPLEREKPEIHPYDFLNSDYSIPENDFELEMLLNFS
jgi:hypothetical protein